MKKLLFLMLAILVVASMLLAGCSSSGTSSATQATTSATQATTSATQATTSATQATTSATQATTSATASGPHKILKIGSVQALSTVGGLEAEKWLTLFAKLYNDAGGWKIGNDVYDVDMIVYDSGGDSAKAKSYLERLVLQDEVKYIMGSPVGDPAIDITVTEPNHVICMGLDTIGDSTDPSIQYYYDPNGMFFARGMMWDIYKSLADSGKYKNYVSCKTDDVMGHAVDGMCNATWSVAAPDIKYISTVFYDSTTVDFGPVATKIKSFNPDILDCNYAGATGLFNALYDVGFRGLILPSQVDPDMFDAVLTHCGKAFMEGWQYFLQDPRLYPNQPQKIKDYLTAYEKEYGDFQTGGCMWVAYWFVFENAVVKTQSTDVDVLKAFLDKNTEPVRTLTGWNQMFARPDCNNYRNFSGVPADFVAVVQDGQTIPWTGVAIKDHYLASILSYGLVDVYKAYWAQYGYPTFPSDQNPLIKFSDLGVTGHD